MALLERATGLDGARAAAGAAYGALAYVAGYAVTYVLAADDARAALRGPLGVDASAALPDAWRLVGWVFYAAHRVRVEATVRSPQLDAAQTRAVDVTGSAAWDPLLFLVPPAALIGAGALLAWRRGDADGGRGLRDGLLVVVGYGPLAALGAVLFRWTATASAFGVEASVAAAPAPVEVVLFAGVVYPAVFGGLGGSLAALTAS